MAHVQVKCVVETRDWDHVAEMKEVLKEKGYTSIFGSWDGDADTSIKDPALA